MGLSGYIYGVSSVEDEQLLASFGIRLGKILFCSLIPQINQILKTGDT